MRYGKIPGIDKPVSRLIQGAMIIADGDRQGATDVILDAMEAAGITTIDTAHVYGGGSTDRGIGDWMRRRGNRDRMVIIAKGSHHNQERKRVTSFDIESDLHDTLARMGTDYVDLWMFHRDDPQQPIGPLMETLARYVEKGVIHAFGGSNWSVARVREARAFCAANSLPPFVASSPNFSLAEQIDSPWGDDCVTISGPKHADDRAWYAAEQMPVLTWSSLARGFFSGRLSRANFEQVRDQFEEHMIRCYVCEANWRRLDRVEELAAVKGVTVAQLALAWVMRQPMNLFAMVGAVTPTEIAANDAALELPLTPAECDWLDLRRDSPT